MKQIFLFIAALTLAAPLAGAQSAGKSVDDQVDEYIDRCTELASKDHSPEDAAYLCSNPELKAQPGESRGDRSRRERLLQEVQEASIPEEFRGLNPYEVALKKVRTRTRFLKSSEELQNTLFLSGQRSAMKDNCDRAESDATRLRYELEDWDKLPMQSGSVHKMDYLNEFQRVRDEAKAQSTRTMTECRESALRRGGGAVIQQDDEAPTYMNFDDVK